MAELSTSLSSFDKLLSKRNLSYDWSVDCKLFKHPPTGKFSTYVILDTKYSKKISLVTKHIQFKCNYKIVYVGKGVWDDIFTRLRNKRCLQHTNDLYSDCLKEKDRYKLVFVSTALSEEASFMLEAEMIDGLLDQGFELCKQGIRNIEVQEMQLWNKCKGHGNNTRTVI